jgi:hypothetical protein
MAGFALAKTGCNNSKAVFFAKLENLFLFNTVNDRDMKNRTRRGS